MPADQPTFAHYLGNAGYDAVLTGWSKSLNDGEILAFNVDSVSTIQRVTISLKIQKKHSLSICYSVV